MVQRKQVQEMGAPPQARSAVPELDVKVDAQGRPYIERMSARIGDLEHRLDYLERSYDPSFGTPGGRARMVGEIQALRVALVVMRYHELEVGGEKSVVTALERLVKALDTGTAARRQLTADADDALVHAKDVLEELR